MPTAKSITIPFEGKIYRRLNGRWLDASLFVAVAERLSSLLDAEAQRLGIWDSVIEFDRRDKPVRVSHPSSSTRSSTTVSHDFIGDGRTVHITADVTGGWRLLKKAYGFVGDCVLDERYQFPLRIQIKLLHREGDNKAPREPHSGIVKASAGKLTILNDALGDEIALTDEQLAELGYQRYSTLDSGTVLATRLPIIKYEFAEGRLDIWVDLFAANGLLNPALELFKQDGAEKSTVQHCANMSEPDSRYELQFLIVAKEPPRPPIPDEREPLQKGFVHGGRPGSNRRH